MTASPVDTRHPATCRAHLDSHGHIGRRLACTGKGASRPQAWSADWRSSGSVRSGCHALGRAHPPRLRQRGRPLRPARQWGVIHQCIESAEAIPVGRGQFARPSAARTSRMKWTPHAGAGGSRPRRFALRSVKSPCGIPGKKFSDRPSPETGLGSILRDEWSEDVTPSSTGSPGICPLRCFSPYPPGRPPRRPFRSTPKA